MAANEGTKQRQGEAIQLVATLESRVTALQAKRQRVIDAFLHERVIDKTTYQEQLDLLNEEVALTELDIYETKLEGVGFRSRVELCHERTQQRRIVLESMLKRSKQRFQRILFPSGLLFDGESYRTAPTCRAFSYLQGISQENQVWRPVRESNPCRRRERAVS